MGDFGLWTLLPAVVVFVFAILTKRTAEALFIGCALSYLIVSIGTGQNFFSLFYNEFLECAGDQDNQYLLLVCGLFGSFIAILNASKANIVFAQMIKKWVKSEKGVLFTSWIMGIVIFIDDFMNVLTISSCMRKLCKDYKVPDDSLAYVIDSTAAPTCVIIPFSTWAVFFGMAFMEQECVSALGLGDSLTTYAHCIPYMFYAFIALFMVPLFIFGLLPKMGAMKKAYEAEGKSVTERGKEFIENSDKIETKSNVFDFIIPMAVMIVITIVFDNMLYALIAAILVSGALYVPRRIINAQQFCDLWVEGFKDMIPSLAIMLFAFFMKDACHAVNLPQYVINFSTPLLIHQLFPAAAFLIVAALSFVTGDNWGVPSICVPIIMPLAVLADCNILLIMGAVVSGATFGSHACFYSDATVLTAQYCGISNVQHAKSQLPYAMIACGAATILYLIFGFIM